MKEQIHTIPVNEAFESGDECPFCFLERAAERSAIRYVAGPGASYMEPDVREITNKAGFCTGHMKKLYDYGNFLGAALMLQTHLQELQEELEAAAQNPGIPGKKGLFRKKVATEDMPYYKTLQGRTDSCCICQKVEYNMDRYYRTFFVLLKDGEFREKVLSSKGFCLRHFAALLERAEEQLPDKLSQWFYPAMYQLTLENLERVKGDLDWFVAKHDYRNASKPWGNSKDALARTMQKIQGLYPTDPPYKAD